MASRIVLARSSRNSSSSLNLLFSARTEPSLCGSELSTMALNRTAPWLPTVSSFPIKAEVNQFSTFSTLLNGTFQRLGFSSKAWSQSNPSEKSRNEKGLSDENGHEKELSDKNGHEKELSDENVKESSEKFSTLTEEEADSDNKVELPREELMKLLEDKHELLEEEEKKYEMIKDELLKHCADIKNRMIQTEREAENSKKFAIQSFGKGLLDVADNLERASSVVKESFAKVDDMEGDKAVLFLKTLLEGVKMTQKELSKVFREFGLEKYDALNETFDPHRHNAVFEVADPSKPPGTVAVVIKNGYMLHERVIRHAAVGVAKSSD